jgi:UDP-GlcNAc:undecaprenyl-phosphate GlcNAc-1-phosphate transferase
VAAVAAAFFFLLAATNGQFLVASLAAALLGACSGFLFYNFNPARIFMGDAGAMLLGLLLATMTITVGGRTADPFNAQTYFYFAPLAIPLVILGVPLADTVFSFVRRLWRRQSFAHADHEHLHHRLMRMGHGPRRAVVILWLWTALLSAVVLLPTFTNRGNSIVPVGVVALGLLLYIYFHPGVRTAREERDQTQLDQDQDQAQEALGAGADADVVELRARRQAKGGT